HAWLAPLSTAAAGKTGAVRNSWVTAGYCMGCTPSRLPARHGCRRRPRVNAATGCATHPADPRPPHCRGLRQAGLRARERVASRKVAPSHAEAQWPLRPFLSPTVAGAAPELPREARAHRLPSFTPADGGT